MDKSPEDLTPRPDYSPSKQIVFKNGNNEFQVSIQEFNELFADIKKYNGQFSIGTMMVQALKSSVEDQGGQNTHGEVLKSFSKDQQHMTASGISVMNEATLNKLGLSLEPVSGGSTMYSGGEEASEGEMRFNVADRNQFLAFLGGLEQEHAANTEVRQNLQNLAGVLSRQLSGHYDLEKPQEEMLELFGNLDGIIEQYKRLGLDDYASKLATYLGHARNGCLREFIEIERDQLLGEPRKSFGPADWQRDMGVSGVSEHWDKALDVLERLKSNPRAQELYDQLRGHLTMSLQTARESLETLTYLADVPDTKVGFMQVFDQVGAELAEIGNAHSE